MAFVKNLLKFVEYGKAVLILTSPVRTGTVDSFLIKIKEWLNESSIGMYEYI